ncbi:MAG TPA: hypothetical protein VGK58_18895, partial [Lacipirellulaceae bacterium]
MIAAAKPSPGAMAANPQTIETIVTTSSMVASEKPRCEAGGSAVDGATDSAASFEGDSEFIDDSALSVLTSFGKFHRQPPYATDDLAQHHAGQNN